MRYIKLLLISVFALFLVLLGFSLLFPSHIRISRAINVAASQEKVLAVLSDLHSWDQWNSFIRTTPLTGRSLSDPSSGKGAYLHSDQLSVREEAYSPDSMRFQWQQAKGRTFYGGFNLLQLRSDSLTVQWWFDFHFRWYPWEKLGSLVYDPQLGPVMEESLASLKRYVENSP